MTDREHWDDNLRAAGSMKVNLGRVREPFTSVFIRIGACIRLARRILSFERVSIGPRRLLVLCPRSPCSFRGNLKGFPSASGIDDTRGARKLSPSYRNVCVFKTLSPGVVCREERPRTSGGDRFLRSPVFSPALDFSARDGGGKFLLAKQCAGTSNIIEDPRLRNSLR